MRKPMVSGCGMVAARNTKDPRQGPEGVNHSIPGMDCVLSVRARLLRPMAHKNNEKQMNNKGWLCLG